MMAEGTFTIITNCGILKRFFPFNEIGLDLNGPTAFIKRYTRVVMWSELLLMQT